ncbi:MAG TPA: NAD(P)H-quinone oxidoreductase [Gemmatimonadales bacterium]|nr:NAD(P)H-quinone oxidoreductase [Gemmatimonadales bacterium]
MRFLRVKEEGGAYRADLVEGPNPEPRPGEVLIRVAASGVNRADLSQIAGRYPPPAGESLIIGLEVSGRLVGTDQPVCALLGGGGHAECVAAPQAQVFPAPSGVDLVTAAAIPEAFLTAYVNLVFECGLAAGDTVLIHAGASGVGLAAIQLAKLLGARVAATTRTPEKVPALQTAGADLGVAGDAEHWAGEIERTWGPGVVDIVLDPVGASTYADDVRLLATRGRIVCIATMGGAQVPIDLALLMKKRARLIGSTLRARSREEKARLVAEFRERVLPAFGREGGLRPVVDAVFPPDRAAEAFQRMRENRNVGKILIRWE